MATRSKKARASGKQYPSPQVNGFDYPEYVQLRTMLDSVTVGALRYYLNDTDPGKKRDRYDFLDRKLMDIINVVWDKLPEVDCPDGYHDCGGCCVPYACPE